MGRSALFVSAFSSLLALCGGCTSIASLHTARPLPVGATEVVFAPGAYVFEDTDDGESETLRFGERVDAGVRTTSFSMLSADVNFAVVKTERFALSIDPSVSYFGLPFSGDFSITYLWLPVLADVYTSDDLTVTVAVKPGYASVDLDDDDDDFWFDESTELLGFGIGARWRIGERTVVLPELNLVTFDDDELGDQRIWTFTLGFAF